MTVHYRLVARLLGILIVFIGVAMLVPAAFAVHTAEFLLSAGITIATGSVLWLLGWKTQGQDLSKKDGYLVVTLAWLSMSAFGCLPYLLTGAIGSVTDAFFETLSGFSTTGATILTDIEAQPRDILFWRSLTQWMGGMGIIVLAVAILPLLGIGGQQLFVAESPGINADKLKPRIQDTAKRLWLIYVSLTAVELVALRIAGMNWYEALNHALTTMATGGFSTRNDSIAGFSPAIQWIIICFMFLAGTNFTITYFLLKRRFGRIWANEEFKTYAGFTLLFGALVAAGLLFMGGTSTEEAVRTALFQVVSLVTTTGYITADYSQWIPVLLVIIFLIMFMGGSAGSTAGGIKVVRHLVLFRNTFSEIKRQLHPSAVIPVRLNKRVLTQDTTYNILAFIILYVSIFGMGTAVVALTGIDFVTSLGATATCLGNIGPGLGTVGPVDNFAHLPAFTKWFLAILMLVGRLELFTVLMLLSPSYWKKV